MKNKRFRNLAAKYARSYNKSSVFRDRKKEEKKGKRKHKKQKIEE